MPATDSRILLADDHPLFRSALVQAVQQQFPTAEIIQADSAPAVYDVMETHSGIDLCLLDLNIPGAYGFSTLVFLRGNYPGVPVVIVSAVDDPSVIAKAIAHEAAGYIPKSLPGEQLQTALAAVFDGELWVPEGTPERAPTELEGERDLAEAIASLTPQQFRVLTMVADGMLNKQIAYELDVTEATIKAHMTAILRKLGVNNRTAAVIACQKLDVQSPTFSV